MAKLLSDIYSTNVRFIGINFEIMKRILEKINTENEILVLPIVLGLFSEPLNCYFNVRKMVEHDGGQIVYGWRIHDGEFILESERHAVWRNLKGELIDITPNESDNSSLFVVEDKGWVYNNIDQDNIRINKTNNVIVDDFIKILESKYKLWNLMNRNSEKTIQGTAEVYDVIAALEGIGNYLWSMIVMKRNENGVCYCGKLIRYSSCHRKTIFEDLDIVVEDLTSKYYMK